MPKFILTYRSPRGYVAGSSPDAMAAWQAWFGAMGDHLVDLGQPVVDRADLGECGGTTELGGYSLVSAVDLDEALVIAKGCPFVGEGGGVEVGVLGDLPGA